MPVAPGKIKVENKLHVIQHATQEKAAASTHSMNDVIALYTFNTPFQSSSSITQNGNTFYSK